MAVNKLSYSYETVMLYFQLYAFKCMTFTYSLVSVSHRQFNSISNCGHQVRSPHMLFRHLHGRQEVTMLWADLFNNHNSVVVFFFLFSSMLGGSHNEGTEENAFFAKTQCMTETTKRHWVYKASILSLFCIMVTLYRRKPCYGLW